MNPLHLMPGHLNEGYLHVDIGLHERNVCGLMMSILLSGSSIVYEVKPLTSTSSCALLSRSITENSKRGSVTSSPVSESSKVNVMFTYDPDWIAIMPNAPLHPLTPLCGVGDASGDGDGSIPLSDSRRNSSISSPTGSGLGA